MGREKTVLFCSKNSLDRAENLKAVYDAYPFEKEYFQTHDGFDPGRPGYAAIVCDDIPHYNPDKVSTKFVFIGHGIPGGKTFGLDMPRKYVDLRVPAQIDYAVSTGRGADILISRQLGVPMERIKRLGMPRTDAYFQKGRLSATFDFYKRVYLYAPTFRDGYERALLPKIDYEKIDRLLDVDELFVVKRHYFTGEPLVKGSCTNVIEVPQTRPVADILMNASALLTDFSSIIMDAYLMGIPAVLTLDNMEGYLEERGMYYPYPSHYSSRSIFAEGNEEELVESLRLAASEGLTDRERKFIDEMADACDGHSSERVAKFVASLVY